MGKFRKNVKTAGMARGRVDKAQNNLLKELKKDVDELKSSVETKYAYINTSTPVDSYSGATAATRNDQIFKIDIGETQGDGDTQRIGDKITLKHIDLKYRLSIENPRPSEYNPAQTTCRIFMFWDNQPNNITSAGATATNEVYWPELLQLALVGTTSDQQKEALMVSHKDWDNRKRFSIIYDKTHTLSPTFNGAAPLAGSPNEYQQNGLGSRSCTGINSFSKKYKGQQIRFTAGGSIPNNRQLYFAFLSDVGNVQGSSPSLSANRPLITSAIRCLYDDI